MIKKITLLDLYHLRQATIPRRDAETDLKKHGAVARHVEGDHERDGQGDEGEAAVLKLG